jgi:hypothetical protein
MISGIYPYLMSMSAGGLKKGESSFQNTGNAKFDDLTNVTGADRVRLGTIPAADEGISLTVSGAVTQASTGLFAQVSDIGSGQDIPQMMMARRGYEAYLETIRAKDETLRYTLDTFV